MRKKFKKSMTRKKEIFFQEYGDWLVNTLRHFDSKRKVVEFFLAGILVALATNDLIYLFHENFLFSPKYFYESLLSTLLLIGYAFWCYREISRIKSIETKYLDDYVTLQEYRKT